MGLDNNLSASTIWFYMGDYFKTFREQIVNILKEKGLKQKDLAEMLGVDKSNISQLFSGVRRFNEETIEAICRVLNVSPMKLFSGNKPVPGDFRSHPEKKSIGCDQSVCNILV